MLILTRKPGQVLKIDLRKDVDLKMPVGELFAQGPIEVMVTAVNGAKVKLGIHADPRFLDRWFRTRATSSIPGVVILREELCVREPEAAYKVKRVAVYENRRLQNKKWCSFIL